MPPLQAFFLVSSVVIFAVAWMRGGHVERRVVWMMLLAYVASVFSVAWEFDRFRPADVVIDVAFLVALTHLALTRDRWWLIPAAAAQVLTVLSHAHLLLDPDVTLRANIAVRWAFGVLLLYCLLGGVVERWLAGEAPAMPRLRHQRVSRDGLNI